MGIKLSVVVRVLVMAVVIMFIVAVATGHYQLVDGFKPLLVAEVTITYLLQDFPDVCGDPVVIMAVLVVSVVVMIGCLHRFVSFVVVTVVVVVGCLHRFVGIVAVVVVVVSGMPAAGQIQDG